MYKVIWKDAGGVACDKDVDSLDSAMGHAKQLNCLVTIKGNGMEIVGLFGADSIENGVCPDGAPYTWMKRRNS
jgi:hypothetical protein